MSGKPVKPDVSPQYVGPSQTKPPIGLMLTLIFVATIIVLLATGHELNVTKQPPKQEASSLSEEEELERKNKVADFVLTWWVITQQN